MREKANEEERKRREKKRGRWKFFWGREIQEFKGFELIFPPFWSSMLHFRKVFYFISKIYIF